ncbi:MAG: RusA family crossover junction endodeoxyribonuclease [Candidatus Eremiobacteraeota bacterium]|nr:RusA family crossover junction endodeoxyribonuclease [Candidatus Eremiobacteraeota bacterium]
MIARFTAVGIPQPQGSKSPKLLGKWIMVNGQRALLNARAVLIEGRSIKRKDGTWSDGPKRHKRWREAVRLAALDFQRRTGWETVADPCSMVIAFYLPRPASLPKRVLFPAKKPDLSKLARAAEDSLSGIIYVDDALVVTSLLHKRFAIGSVPRAEIMVERLVPYAVKLPL